MKHSIKLLVLLMLFMASCDGGTSLPPYTPLVYLEDFEDAEDNTILNITGFTNYAETGTTLWTEQLFNGNGYTEFPGDSESPSAGWLITPSINLEITKRTLHFQSAQHHLPQEGSKLEIFIATDYNGTDISSANWIKLQAMTPTIYTEWYKFISSGEISLADYSGIVHIAFKATHTISGGGYYIDNVKVH